MKNRKASEPDTIKIELLKYKRMLLELRLQHLLMLETDKSTKRMENGKSNITI